MLALRNITMWWCTLVMVQAIVSCGTADTDNRTQLSAGNFLSTHYEAERLPHRFGEQRPITPEGFAWVIPPGSGSGHAIFGPYARWGQGDRRAIFRMSIDNRQSSANLLRIDIWNASLHHRLAQAGTSTAEIVRQSRLAERIVHPTDFPSAGPFHDIDMSFTIKPEYANDLMEVRVEVLDPSHLQTVSIDWIRIENQTVTSSSEQGTITVGILSPKVATVIRPTSAIRFNVTAPSEPSIDQVVLVDESTGQPDIDLVVDNRPVSGFSFKRSHCNLQRTHCTYTVQANASSPGIQPLPLTRLVRVVAHAGTDRGNTAWIMGTDRIDMSTSVSNTVAYEKVVDQGLPFVVKNYRSAAQSTPKLSIRVGDQAIFIDNVAQMPQATGYELRSLPPTGSDPLRRSYVLAVPASFSPLGSKVTVEANTDSMRANGERPARLSWNVTPKSVAMLVNTATKPSTFAQQHTAENVYGGQWSGQSFTMPTKATVTAVDVCAVTGPFASMFGVYLPKTARLIGGGTPDSGPPLASSNAAAVLSTEAPCAYNDSKYRWVRFSFERPIQVEGYYEPNYTVTFHAELPTRLVRQWGNPYAGGQIYRKSSDHTTISNQDLLIRVVGE